MLCFDVTHYHFSEWPDHGVPTDKMCMIEFIGHIREVHPPEGAPLVVHCSAGVGRTGTFIVLDTMLQRLEQEESLNIYDFLLEIRHQRVKLVQTEVGIIYMYDVMFSLLLIYRSSICTFMNVYQSISSVVIHPFLSLEHMILSEN